MYGKRRRQETWLNPYRDVSCTCWDNPSLFSKPYFNCVNGVRGGKKLHLEIRAKSARPSGRSFLPVILLCYWRGTLSLLSLRLSLGLNRPRLDTLFFFLFFWVFFFLKLELDRGKKRDPEIRVVIALT